MKRLVSVLAALVLVFSVVSACAADESEYIVTEESGGVFRPLPINLDGG